jgi:predicted PurR-regulated permease PerM
MNGSTRRIEGILGIVALSLLAVGCVLVLWPFASSLMWAVILTFSTWPVYAWLEEKLGGRSSLAALLMTLLLATALILPMVLVGTSMADDARAMFEFLRERASGGLPSAPGWVAELPLVGGELARSWNEMAANTGTLVNLVAPYLAAMRDFLLVGSATVGRGLLELTLSVAATFFFYRDGRYAAERLRTMVHRVAGDRAHHLIQVAGDTITSVVYGLIGTALVQGTLAAIGFAIVGIDKAVFLGILTAVLALLPPLGPPLVWGPVTAWLFYEGAHGWGAFMLVWGFFVISGVDNFLKPYLISRGSDLGLLLVFLGVIGGILAFGFLGIFLGPTLLAVGVALLREWSARAPLTTPDESPSA